jgi:glycosyltransferase involved in cell wall biosynthesis
MELKDNLTIVIPCKNEGLIISKTLDLLNYQKHIDGVNVIVCDSSDDLITKKLLIERNNDRFILTLTDGGYPSIARNKGVKMSKTSYILFLDADIFLLNDNHISEALSEIIKNDYHLLSCKFNTTNGEYNSTYNLLHKIQKITKFISPFALGGFMLIKKDTFVEVGGFDEEITIAEDYDLSKKIKPSKFTIIDRVVFTTPRRFKNKGIYYMIKIFIGSYINRNNKNYFKDDKGYWK